MKINGHDYGFAYTVGAYLDIAEMKMIPKTNIEVDKLYMYTAVLLSKGFEDRKKLEDPDYEPVYLTMKDIRSMDVADMAQLREEVDAAYKKGMRITVETQPKENAKKKEGAIEGV